MDPSTLNEECQKAILKTIKECPSLNKDGYNKHASYKYVSIDDFYKTIAPIASANGIHWKAKEVKSEITVLGEKKSLLVMIEYSFSLFFRGIEYQDYFRCSIIHPLQGAQTTGSALSYADKLFMRHVFKVQTGEGDADSAPFIDTSADDLLGDSKPVVKAPKPPAGMDADQLAAVKNMTVEALALARTDDQLSKLWTDNETTYKAVESASKPAYTEIVGLYKTRKLELKKEAAGG